MVYRVLVDGEDVLDYNDPELVLLSPQLEVELDVSGSFEFTVPPNHKMYNDFTPESIMAMTIEVWEDNIMHWFGRPIEYHLDFYKNKKINCEGGLAFFNDSVIRAEEWDETFLSDIFQAVLAEHNTMVPSNRQFSFGSFTVNDGPVYRKFNYEQTFDVLKSKFLDAVDGHFFVRRENGVNYLDFLKDMPYTCNQDVEFSENLLNFTYSFDGKDFATCVIPLGANDPETGEPIDIKSVNSGSDILIGSSAAVYGNIVKVQQYGDIEHPEELITEGRKYLTTLQYNAFLIECSAVDLHSKDPTQQLFRVGQMVTCTSVPHGLQIELPISKMILYLDSAAKQITLGRIPKKTLSRFYKEKVSDGGGNYGAGEADEIPDGWAVVPPDTDGGSPTMKRVPSNITIHEAPLQIHYNQDATIDFTRLKIRILTPKLDGSGLETYTDSNYPTGIISYPSSELILPVTKVTQKTAQIKVPVMWRCPYTGQLMQTFFQITNDTAAAAEAAHGGPPDHIEAFVTKLGGVDPQVYKNGQRIHLNGIKVYAYWPDGSRYDADGYNDGLIPNTEITFQPKIANYEDAEYAYDTGTAASDYGTVPYVVGGFNAQQYSGGSPSWRHGTWSGNGFFFSTRGDNIPNNYCSFDSPTLIFAGADDNVGQDGTHTYNLSLRTNPIDGEKYYVISNFFGWANGVSGWTVVASPICSGNPNVQGYWPEDVLMAAMKGKVPELNKKQTITVSWKRPGDGEVLTATYQVTVKSESSGSGGGR